MNQQEKNAGESLAISIAMQMQRYDAPSTLLQPLYIELRKKEPPPAFVMVTQGMMVSEALPTFLVTSTTSPPASHSRTYNSYATNLPPLGLHWVAS